MTVKAGFLLGLLLLSAGGVLAQPGTEFGGGVTGSDSIISNVLSSVSGQTGFRWIRSSSRLVPQYGFEGISDVRLHVPRSGARDELPDDLLETFRACRDRLPAFPGAPKVWEVWNEPDFYFIRNSAADMAATLKAAWWGVKTAQPDAEVLMPSLAFRPGRYALELAANGLASWTDGWNAHFYGWAADYPSFLAHHGAFAQAIGCDKPLWITEIGHIGMLQTAADDPAAQALQAAFHERTMIESWARGVDRHLNFLLTPYVEARHEFGLTSVDGRWRPAMTSAVRIARALQGCRPVFRIVHRASDEDIGIVLSRESGSWWTILWSPGRPGASAMPEVDPRHPVPDTIRLRPSWPASWSEVRTGIEGDTALGASQVRELELTPGRNVHLHGPPVRFGLAGCRWVPWTDDAGATLRISRQARVELESVPPVREPSPVVVRLRPEPPIREDKPAQTLRFPVDEIGVVQLELYNFSEQPRSGVWNLEVPHGWSAPNDAQSRRVELLPLSRVSIPLRVRIAAGMEAERSDPLRLRVRWSGDDASIDEASVRVEVEQGDRPIWHRFDWKEIVARPGRTDAWQVYQQSADVIVADVRSPSGLNQEMALHFAVPRGVRARDAFSVRLRHVSGAGSPYVQPLMTTAEGEGWRHGELTHVGSHEIALEARLSDFSPSIWGRHRSFLFPVVEEMRWLTLTFQGLQPGDVLEIRDAVLRR